MSRRGPRRILFVIGSLAVGGTERQLVLLASRLHARGWNVSVIAMEKTGPLVAALEATGVRVIDGGYRSEAASYVKGPLLALSAIRVLFHALVLRPDVIHSFLPLSNFIGAVAGRLAFVPLVVTSKRALGGHQDRQHFWKWIDRLTNALSGRIVANSRAVARDTQLRDGYDVSRIVVIPNGLELSAFDDTSGSRDILRGQLGLSSAEIAVVMVANLIPYKGHLELIQAFAHLTSEDGRFRLFLVGRDDGIGADLAAEAERLGIRDKIDLTGPRTDIPRFLSAMDVGVMASHEEGFSNALLEKLAAGLPVVATDVGGNPEALEGMPGCVLVRPRDVEDIARGLRVAIGRSGMDEEGRQLRLRLVQERYSVEAMVDAYERLYLENS